MVKYLQVCVLSLFSCELISQFLGPFFQLLASLSKRQKLAMGLCSIGFIFILLKRNSERLKIGHPQPSYYFWSSGNQLILRTKVWPDWAIYWTLDNLTKLLETINLPKSPTFLGDFCKGVKIFNFSSEIIFGQLLQTFGDFLLVTVV